MPVKFYCKPQVDFTVNCSFYVKDGLFSDSAAKTAAAVFPRRGRAARRDATRRPIVKTIGHKSSALPIGHGLQWAAIVSLRRRRDSARDSNRRAGVVAESNPGQRMTRIRRDSPGPAGAGRGGRWTRAKQSSGAT